MQCDLIWEINDYRKQNSNLINFYFLSEDNNPQRFPYYTIKKAKAMDIMLKLRKVTFINIDNLPKEDEPEWISTPACLESVMIHIWIKQRYKKSSSAINVWSFDNREHRPILTKQHADHQASVSQTDEWPEIKHQLTSSI